MCTWSLNFLPFILQSHVLGPFFYYVDFTLFLSPFYFYHISCETFACVNFLPIYFSFFLLLRSLFFTLLTNSYRVAYFLYSISFSLVIFHCSAGFYRVRCMWSLSQGPFYILRCASYSTHPHISVPYVIMLRTIYSLPNSTIFKLKLFFNFLCSIPQTKATGSCYLSQLSYLLRYFSILVVSTPQIFRCYLHFFNFLELILVFVSQITGNGKIIVCVLFICGY